jgi:CheY-like chemotaxis protein
MHAASQRAAELSQRLVAFARGEAHANAVTDLSAVCSEVAQLVRRTCDRSIMVITDIAPQLAIAGPSLDMHQVLLNLCLNARDAMPDGGSLTITAARHQGPAGMLTVTVEDTGGGMDEATQRQIFDPFFTTKGGGGYGLGLATVRDIVVLLGGLIDVTSTPGEGSRFVVHLPENNQRSRRRITSTVRQKGELRVGTPLQILVVDDEDMVRRGVRRVLEQAGHEISEAASGREALALFSSAARPPDVVLLDLDMPDQRGEDVLRELLQQRPDAVVLMVSGHSADAHEAELIALGARGFVRKPWQRDELLRIIDKVLEPPRPDGDDDDDGDRPTNY